MDFAEEDLDHRATGSGVGAPRAPLHHAYPRACHAERRLPCDFCSATAVDGRVLDHLSEHLLGSRRSY